MPAPPFDPLADLRAPGDPQVDVLLQGMVFLDIIFSGLSRMPGSGEELWAEGMGSCPGGAANLAVATARLGLRTSLSAAFGDDDYGDFCWRTLAEQEHIDLSTSQRFEHWHTPVTVSIAVDDDRRMVTHGHEAPEPATTMMGTPPRSRAVLFDLTPNPREEDVAWIRTARDQGALLFAEVGFDGSGVWDPATLGQLDRCHAFTPNAVEAMAYTRTDTPYDALYALADLVPLAVVTNGSQGALAIDSSTGEEATVPALRVASIDPTGAGDVFCAALTLGTLARWELRHRLNFAALCSSLAVQEFGGSLAAPGWGDIADWWHAQCAAEEGTALQRAVRRRFEFLDDLVPAIPPSAVRRAAATIARRSDV
ncbi:carbohydrate kinase family protein [Luteipulveratus flavus]|uniref:PfkB family carbohydrate kinase n=1 Tax=Luteipulveratus flavus TaxID=3031728 RepID=A0ABT6CAF7_9MICO|nr:PfkB family carbohydrate kinase [Luteipulveratus sp. YIM 133296]MDF8265875.1 PfkB family carbohydrate kinase [Luteipulveratus sp. YIM 133296]